MEKNSSNSEGNSDHIPVHGLSSLYLDTVSSSPVAKFARPRKSYMECGHTEPSSPKAPVRTNSSRHAIRLVDQHSIDLDDSEEDNGSDDGVDEEEDHDDGDDDDIVPIKLPIVDPYGDRGDYEGGILRTSLKDLADGCPIPSGPNGTMKYADGRVYQGHWKNGSWHGHGRTSYPNGDIYEGDYEDDQRHGIGIYQWRDGRVFQGNFRNDQRNGHGVFKWPDGSTYVGGFQEGQRHGEGTYSFQDGSVYTGEWKRGSRHGLGEYHWVDDRIYKGEWVDGKAHGYGTETRPDGSIRHDGKWENDSPI